MTATTSSSSPGLSKASYVAEASPFSMKTHQHTATKAATTTATTKGLNSRAKGVVSRRVRSGSETAYLNRSASSGLDFLTSGCVPSARASSPIGRSWPSTRVRTLASDTVRPKRSLTRSATSA